jgi:hypothetical protein
LGFTLALASRSGRLRIMRLVTLLPAWPPGGLLLTEKRIASIGGSIGGAGRDVVAGRLQAVLASLSS